MLKLVHPRPVVTILNTCMERGLGFNIPQRNKCGQTSHRQMNYYIRCTCKERCTCMVTESYTCKETVVLHWWGASSTDV